MGYVFLFTTIIFLAIFYQLSQLIQDDDNLYFYTVGQHSSYSDKVNDISRSIQTHQTNADYNDEQISRFQFRQHYMYNYIFHTAILALTQLTNPPTDLFTYHKHQRNMLLIGTIIGHFVCLLLVAYALLTSRSPNLVFSALAASGFDIFLYLFSILFLPMFLNTDEIRA